jgi:transposase
MEEQIEQLDREALGLLQEHQDVVQRVAEVPGFGVDSALQMIAEVGPEAAAFRSEKALASWVGVCPGEEESAGE